MSACLPTRRSVNLSSANHPSHQAIVVKHVSIVNGRQRWMKAILYRFGEVRSMASRYRVDATELEVRCQHLYTTISAFLGIITICMRYLENDCRSADALISSTAGKRNVKAKEIYFIFYHLSIL